MTKATTPSKHTVPPPNVVPTQACHKKEYLLVPVSVKSYFEDSTQEVQIIDKAGNDVITINLQLLMFSLLQLLLYVRMLSDKASGIIRERKTW